MPVNPEYIETEPTPSTPDFAAAFAAADSGETVQSNAPIAEAVDAAVENKVTEVSPVLENTTTEATPVVIESEVKPEVVVVEPTAAITEQPVKEVVVEKIIEKHPEIKNAAAKSFYDAIVGEDDAAAMQALIDYSREKARDYNVMSEQDVIKADLAKKNPNWDRGDIETEIEKQYGDLVKIDLTTIDKDVEPDDYRDALAHNKSVDLGLKLLARDAKDARVALIEKQKSLELPKLENKALVQTQAEEPSAEAIAEANRQWGEQVENETKDFGAISVRIGDRQLSYNLTDGDKKNTITAVKEFNPQQFFKAREWIGEDGKTNSRKIAEDLFKLNNFEKVINAYSSQAENSAKLAMMKDIKNINPSTTSVPTSPVSFMQAFDEARNRADKN